MSTTTTGVWATRTGAVQQALQQLGPANALTDVISALQQAEAELQQIIQKLSMGNPTADVLAQITALCNSFERQLSRAIDSLTPLRLSTLASVVAQLRNLEQQLAALFRQILTPSNDPNVRNSLVTQLAQSAQRLDGLALSVSMVRSIAANNAAFVNHIDQLAQTLAGTLRSLATSPWASPHRKPHQFTVRSSTHP